MEFIKEDPTPRKGFDYGPLLDAVARINRTGSGLVFPAGRPSAAVTWSASSPLDVVTVLLDQIGSAS